MRGSPSQSNLTTSAPLKPVSAANVTRQRGVGWPASFGKTREALMPGRPLKCSIQRSTVAS